MLKIQIISSAVYHGKLVSKKDAHLLCSVVFKTNIMH